MAKADITKNAIDRLNAIPKETYRLPAEVEAFIHDLVSQYVGGSWPGVKQKTFIKVVTEEVNKAFKIPVTDNQVRTRLASAQQKR